jgi:hypothetical protein
MRSVPWLLSATAALAMLLAGLTGAAPAHMVPMASSSNVLAVYQTPHNITEQSNFSVYLEVADASNIQQVYFTFCQLTSSLCYLPIAMTLQGTNLFVGTTKPMTNYLGMKVGIKAGYNITVVYTDNSTFNEPSLPNAFSNLTVTQSVTGENMFEMVVADHVYGLTGVVKDAATGAPVSGAKVSLTPDLDAPTTTNSTGAYSFSGLSNGSYSVSVTSTGYKAQNVTVMITGQSAVQNVGVSTAGGNTGNPGNGPSGSGGNFLASSVGLSLLVIAAVVVLVVAFVAFSFSSRKKRRAPPPPSEPEDGRKAPPRQP